MGVSGGEKMTREWIQYPQENLVSERSGIKVGWRTYSDRATAEVCAEAAANNALIQLANGYDFGYQYPSAIRETEDGNFEVTIP